MLTSGSVAFLDLKGFTQLSIVCMALWTSFSSFYMRGALVTLWCLMTASYIPAVSLQVCRILALSWAFRIQRWTAIKTYKTYLFSSWLCTNVLYCKRGMQQTLLFQTSRTYVCEIDFFTSLTKSCGEIALSACDNDIDHKCTHVYLYQWMLGEFIPYCD